MKGFVTFIDILGFKELVFYPEKLEKLFEDYNQILTNRETNSNIQFGIFSDSIVIYSNDDTQESFRELVVKTSNVFAFFLGKGIPIRGCISYGNIFTKKDTNGFIIAGDSITDAYYYEQMQNWIGIIISPTLLKKYEKFNELILTDYFGIHDIRSILINYKKIPFHLADRIGEEYYDGFSVFPIDKSGFITVGIYDKIIERLKWNKLQASDVKSQKKYDNTIEYIYSNSLDKLKKLIPKDD